MPSLLSRGEFRQKLANVVKNFQTLISNDPGFKLFTLYKILMKKVVGNNLAQLSLVYFVKVTCCKFYRKCAILGEYFCDSNTGGLCTLNQSCSRSGKYFSF